MTTSPGEPGGTTCAWTSPAGKRLSPPGALADGITGFLMIARALRCPRVNANRIWKVSDAAASSTVRPEPAVGLS